MDFYKVKEIITYFSDRKKECKQIKILKYGKKYPNGGGRKGGSYPDITATKGGRIVRVNTVDITKSGAMTKREAINAARIRRQRPFDHLLIISK